ncbi:MAG: hypothetical protein WA618_01990 [Terriglobales bacterium]
MIRGTIGFGQCDNRGAALTFDLPTSAGNPGYPSFDTIVGGPGGTGGGNAAQKWNGNQMFTRIFDLQPNWTVGMNLMPFYQIGSSTLWALDKFLQLASSTQNISAFEIQTNGSIAVISGGDGTPGVGTLVDQTTQTFPVGQWSGYLEFFVVGTTVEIWANDIKILQCTVPALGSADRILLGTQNGTRFGVDSQPYFGLTFANIYFADGQGALPWNTRLGPIRITTLSPNADAGGNWNISPNTILNRYQAVDDIYPTDGNGSPDGDNSYINPLATGTQQWFTVAGAPCYGLILGVMVNICFRGSSGSTTCDALLLQGTDQVTIGTDTVTGLYQTQQYFQGLSLATGMYFVDSELSGALWGAQTSSTGLMLTQLFLEKIVSLRNTPFSCGQNSYSF